ncbi:MAG: type 1 glutamine amidotransferase domain-containing protein [Acidimicrobiia bacterium]
MAVGILVAPLFEESELIYPYYRLQEAGYQVLTIGPEAREYRGKHGHPFSAETRAADVDPGGLQGLVVPGGYSPDHMRRDPACIDLVRKVFDAGKPVAAICHAGWMLASAGVLEGRRATSFFSIRDDMVNAGAKWTDEPVVVDGNLITSRRPSDLPRFTAALLNALAG